MGALIGKIMAALKSPVAGITSLRQRIHAFKARRDFRKRFRKLGVSSLYLVLLIMPGGLFLIPLLAWWLNRRRPHTPQELPGSSTTGDHPRNPT